MSDKMLHVQIEQPTEAEVNEIRDLLEDKVEGQVVISGTTMSIGEVPALDDFADELADRVAKKVEEKES